MARQLKMMGICGTYGLDSANGRMLEIVSELLKEQGIEWLVWDNKMNPLPLSVRRDAGTTLMSKNINKWLVLLMHSYFLVLNIMVP